MNRENEKKSPIPVLILLGVTLLFGLGDAAMGILIPLLLVVGTMIPFGFAFWLVRRAARKNKEHSHDRIDHRQDVKINPKTGKREAVRRTPATHSPREHWKQQLDALLANGTIDRKEYNALLNRRF